jgi:2-keto-myo-inositol isomerase
MIPCISQVTTLTSSFADDLTYGGAGFPAIEVWLTKLEQHLEAKTASETAKLCVDSGLALAAAAYQGGLLTSQGQQRTVHFDHFKNRLDLCQQFGIPVLILTTGFTESVNGMSLAVAMKNLVEAARWAAGFGVKLALEFHGSDAFCNNLDTALTLIEQCGEPNLGVCLDAFHFHRGPSQAADLARLTTANLFHVQLCDVAGVPREWMADSDRVMPGDGDFHLSPIVDRLRAIGYAGAVSVELMNPTIWSVSASQVCETARRSLERLGVVG